MGAAGLLRLFILDSGTSIDSESIHQEIRKLSRDAVAGAIHPTDRIYGAIIVESAGNSGLSQLARAIADNRPVEGAEFTDFEQIQLAGKPAIRFGMEGRAEGSPSTWRPSSSCIRATHI